MYWVDGHSSVKPLHLFTSVKKEVKAGAKVYSQHVLEDVVKHLSNTLFDRKHWIFKQASAPIHKAKTSQQWLESNIPGLTDADDWLM